MHFLQARYAKFFMKISKKVINYLEKNGYKYELIQHKTTYTAWDVSQTEHVKPSEVAKTLVMKADKDCFLALVPANRNIDKQKMLKIFNMVRKKNGQKECKKIEFAKETWMKKNIFGKVGAVPPFRGLIKSEIFFDKLLSKNKKIYVGSGEYEISILVLVKDYLEKEQPKIGNFSVKK